MQIILLRHGEAEQYADTDANRNLTARGRGDLAYVLEDKNNQLQGIDCLFHSPYIRTTQTAQIAKRSLSLASNIIHTSDAIVPEANPRKFIQQLAQCHYEKILVVTHQPFIGILLDTLCDFEPGRYRLGTSALAAVDAPVVAAGCANLLWITQPEYC